MLPPISLKDRFLAGAHEEDMNADIQDAVTATQTGVVCESARTCQFRIAVNQPCRTLAASCAYRAYTASKAL